MISHNGKQYSLDTLPKWARETIENLLWQREELRKEVGRLQQQSVAPQGSSGAVQRAKAALKARGYDAGRIIQEVKALRARTPGLELAEAIIRLEEATR